MSDLVSGLPESLAASIKCFEYIKLSRELSNYYAGITKLKSARLCLFRWGQGVKLRDSKSPRL